MNDFDDVAVSGDKNNSTLGNYKRKNSWPLLWLSILRFSEGLQSGETAEGFRLLFLYDKSDLFAL